MTPPALAPDDERLSLRADCSACAALCCVLPAFSASADFALDKPAGRPCPNLSGTACGIHAQLRERGFPGCTAFDCFGAGQRLVAADPAHPLDGELGDALASLRTLHEARWHLAEARALLPDGPLRDEAVELADRLRDAAAAPAAELAALGALGTAGLLAPVGELLARASAALRASSPVGSGSSAVGRGGARGRRRGALVGARLRGADLRGADLRGALLLGADLRGADLGRADLLGADLRGADVRGALLAEALFCTQPQLEAARGDAATTVPPALRRPAWWASTPGPHRPRTGRAQGRDTRGTGGAPTVRG